VENVAEPPANLKAAGEGMIDVLYLTSASFSGSTLATFLLAAQPAIATVGELKATGIVNIERYRCSCGERLRVCAYWKRVAETLGQRGVRFDVSHFGTHFRFSMPDGLADRAVRARVRGTWFEALRSLALRLLPGAAQEFQGILERNRVMIETICGARGARVFLDSSKEPNRLKYMIQSGLWNVKPVHLVRDGRGVTQSLLRRALRRRPGNRRKELCASARHWRRVNEACEQVIGLLPPEATARVRYEDLCREPGSTLEPILRLIGERPVAVPEDFRSIEHHILGNVMRLHRTGIAVDESWKEALRPEDLAEFDEIAGDMNRRYGYV
jgi:hypothetical protein